MIEWESGTAYRARRVDICTAPMTWTDFALDRRPLGRGSRTCTRTFCRAL